MPRRVLVVGGGIAGLTLGCALHQQGSTAEVVEISPEWAPLSSGIFINSNGGGMLARIGLLRALLEGGFSSEDDTMLVFDDSGRELPSVHYPRVGGADVPAIVGIRRSELHGLLLSRAVDLDVPVRLGTTVTDLETGPEGARVGFSDGRTETYDLVVGADGIRSSVRGLLFPERAGPTYSGFSAWRVMAPRPPDLVHKVMMLSAGPRLGIMPLSQDLLYLFGVSQERQDTRYPAETWPQEMAARFGRFQRFAPELFEAGFSWHYTQIEEVRVQRPWAKGCAVLIGDSVHATTPFMAQGAALAMEDAVVLADMLGAPTWSQAPMPALLQAFEERRMPRVEFVQRESLATGYAWGETDDSGAARRAEELHTVMQGHVDAFYEQLAQPV